MLRLHFYGGILVAPFLFLAALSGLMYTFSPQLDRALYQHELSVGHSGGQRMPISAQIASARAAHPEGRIFKVSPAPSATGTTRVLLTVDGMAEGYSRTVFVDPYTGEVLGAETTYGEWLPARAWIDELHRNLHLGEFGRNYSELAASWLWLIALSGLALWTARHAAPFALRAFLVPNRSARGRSRTLSWHGAVGVWALLGLLALSASGLTWSQHAGQSISDLRAVFGWSVPTVSKQLPGAQSARGTPVAEAEQIKKFDVVEAAARKLGMLDPIWIAPATNTSQTWQVNERKRDLPFRMGVASFDPATGAVLQYRDWAHWPFMAKAAEIAIGLHMGITLGITNQIALACVAICLITLIVRGYVMWWQRRPQGSGSAFGPLPKSGALTRLSPSAATAAVAGLGLIGWFFPLLGASLVSFVLADALAHLLAQRKTSADV